MATPKLCWQNWAQLSNAVLSVNSENASYPKEWLQDPLRSRTWRTNTGWTVTTGFNHTITITEGSSSADVNVATVAAGNYATGDLMAEAVSSALNAVGTRTWDCTYNGDSYKFSISHDGVSSSGNTGGINWNSTSNLLAKCIGFNGTSNLSGSTSYTGEQLTYQSRHYAKFDLGADRNVDVILLHFTNVISSGSVKIQAHTSDTTGGWQAPTVSTTMSGTDIWNTWLTSTLTYRHWRFLIDNTKSSAGYTYAGVPYIGEYLQPDPGFSQRYSMKYDQLSEVGFADNGAAFQHEKEQSRSHTLTWVGLTDNEKNKLVKAGEFMRIGRPFFFSIDSTTDADDAVYSILTKGINVSKVAPSYWQITMQVEEAIG